MAVHLIWSRLAQEDLKEVITYGRNNNPSAVRSFAKLLIERVELLVDFPELGHVVHECNDPQIREIGYRMYHIVYRLSPAKNVVEIIRIWHAARGELEFENQP